MSYSTWVGTESVGSDWVGADDGSGGGGSGLLVEIFSDTLSFQDSLSLTGPPPNYFLILGDSLNYITDSPAKRLTYLKTFSDSVNNLADAVSRLVGAPIQAFDSLQFNWADAISVSFRAPLSVTEGDTLALSDSVAEAVGNVPFFVTVADTINNIHDAIRIWNLLKLNFEGNFSISDNIQTKMTHLAKIADQLTGMLDAAALSLVGKPAFSDTLALNDSATVRLNVNLTKSASDTLALNDAIAVELDSNYPQAAVDRIRRYLNDIN